MTEKIFKQLIRLSETKKYLLYMFKSKFDRVDFNFLDQKNINAIFHGTQGTQEVINEELDESIKADTLSDMSTNLRNYSVKHLGSVMGLGFRQKLEGREGRGSSDECS